MCLAAAGLPAARSTRLGRGASRCYVNAPRAHPFGATATPETVCGPLQFLRPVNVDPRAAIVYADIGVVGDDAIYVTNAGGLWHRSHGVDWVTQTEQRFEVRRLDVRGNSRSLWAFDGIRGWPAFQSLVDRARAGRDAALAALRAAGGPAILGS